MKPTQETLKESLIYDEATGAMTWLERPRCHFNTDRGHKRTNSQFSGKEAGGVYSAHCGKRYKRVWLSGAFWQAHRLAWLYMTGEWPKNQIDHIDGNGINNAIANLREATRLDNGRNQKKHITNTSGTSGVSFDKSKSIWRAYIGNNGVQLFLGQFKTKEDAIKARKAKEIELSYHSNHGDDRPL